VETPIELTEAELDEVSGGVMSTISFSNAVGGPATFSVANTASGPTSASVTGTVIIATTPLSSSESGTFTSSST
jgi:hypothetical protein